MSKHAKRKKFPVRLAMIALVIVVAISVVAAAVGLLYRWRAGSGGTVTVIVKSGMNTQDIAALLKSKGVVDNALLFRLYIERQGAQDRLQAGEYLLSRRMSYAEALESLVRGPRRRTYTITIPEGLTVRETAAKVAKESPIGEDAFLEAAVKGNGQPPFAREITNLSLEGYLFPKTYTVNEKTTAAGLVKVMLWQFQRETTSLDFSGAEAKNLSYHNVITIASMIEKEVVKDDERAKVAAVIYNRLRADMPLQIDATVQYALPQWKASLTYQDLEVDSPYNTYRNKGLPPGPICSPGLKSIQAALEPASVDYLYYVLTGDDGTHTFTASDEEFERIKEEQGR